MAEIIWGKWSELAPHGSAARIRLITALGEGCRSRHAAPEQGYRRRLTVAGARSPPREAGSELSAPGTRPRLPKQPLWCRRRHGLMAPASEVRAPLISMAAPVVGL
ncbi:hypothetical protein NDU88_004847 [Pleurodeles waltl]|uniref:Uncharacterized protein n=1 Tax=Pleurodeles waltl TaxID=8319 RepID=A0AAV7V2V5_PLEWA|nr:hypothetical protein NDU88_004847 [Pleurodeles waltl]